MDRRKFLHTSTIGGAALLASACRQTQLWLPKAFRKPDSSKVLIEKCADYNRRLSEILLSGLKAFDLKLSGKRVLLKPNLVEYEKETVINTHPALIGAAIEACKKLGAGQVIVGEGPGHRRDTDGLLHESGLVQYLKWTGTNFVDLNLDNILPVKTLSQFMGTDTLFFPETILAADVLISMPKLKTHHWAGMTLSMKNLFGIIPGVKYGWPKNYLHWHGIENSILDINSTICAHFAIVDGILAMEGNGPIQGKPKNLGVLVMGNDLVAVDSTCARIAGIKPEKIKYLETASKFLGNLEEERIEQIGEAVLAVQQPFEFIKSFHYLKG